MKNCSYKNCKQINPQNLECFAIKKSSKDGHKSRCKSCVNEQDRTKPKDEAYRERSRKRMAKYRALHPERVAAQLEKAKQNPNYKETVKLASAKYRKNHPERVAAQLEKAKQDPQYREKRRLYSVKYREKDPTTYREKENKRNSFPERKTIRRKIANRSRRRNLAKDSAKSMKRYTAKLKRLPEWLTEEHHAEMVKIYKECELFQYLTTSENPLQVDHIIPLQGKNVSGLHVPWNLQILPRDLNVEKSDNVLLLGSDIYNKCENFNILLENVRKNKNRPSN